MTMLRCTMLGSLLAIASLAVGCDSGTHATGGPGGAGPVGGNPGTAGAPGAGGAGGAAGVPLVDWVTDLTANHTDEISPPDTVEDKVIIDTSDPAAFDSLLLAR
ncbi:MAG TPA: hypothetical protein VHU40_13470 [Polyangia bacterium]|jgi:hypothetical protein|nr:hypothetical protein [Polyangia bacterium]